MKNENVTSSIEALTELRVKELLQKDFNEGHFDKERTEIQIKQAKIGMTYVRDREQSKRIEQGQMLRAITLITQDDKLRAEYIKRSLPKLLLKSK